MKITSLLDITGGILLNTPAISFVTQIHTNLNKINEGDLFISSKSDDIYEAVNRGTFCIITDIDIPISDPEIAWIKVDDINQSAIKIIRFLLSNLSLECFYCDNINYELLEIYNPDKSKYFFLNDGLSAIEQINKLQNNSSIISLNKNFITDIYPKTKDFEIKDFEINNLTIHSLFEVSFSISNKFFHKFRLPASYLFHFLSVKEFYSINDIDESKIKKLNAMQPIFLNKSFQIVDFGKSNRFILSSTDPLKLQLDKLFIKKFYIYGRVEFHDVKNDNDLTIYNLIKETNANCLYLINIDENHLKNILFNYAPQVETLL